MLHRKSLFLLLATSFLLSNACLDAEVTVSVTEPIEDTSQARFRFTGTITSERSADISPRIAGLIAQADADFGFEAKKGDLLVRLDDTLAKIDLEGMKIDLEAAREELANTKRLLDEAVGLGDNNFPRTERENRETNFRKAQLTVERRVSAIEKQKEIVERHRIIAPFDGVVSAKLAEVGEWVQTGNPVVSFIDTKNLRLDLQVPQEQGNVVVNSKTAMVTVSGYDHLSFVANNEARSPAVDPKTRTFMVRIRLNSPPDYIKPGMAAEAVFQPRNDRPNLLITRDAILRSGDSEISVWVAENVSGEFRASNRVVVPGNT
ncbi:MAG: efflux RND transporter periplasmic adaptor subunit, partial [Verrucomicrobiae bacterium]|nr:efflux RND transporter periplasmic adaptor subunit [Verrucomicrobiae bacterium]